MFRIVAIFTLLLAGVSFGSQLPMYDRVHCAEHHEMDRVQKRLNLSINETLKEMQRDVPSAVISGFEFKQLGSFSKVIPVCIGAGCNVRVTVKVVCGMLTLEPSNKK